jgi:putative DNA primase/helicase
MFCLASIQVGMEHKADQDRLTKLSLMKVQDDSGAAEKWSKIKDALYEIKRDGKMPSRMLRRAINMLPTIHKNIAVFITAAAKKFGTQRLGDQYGTLLAGAWSMAHSEVATMVEAEAMIDYYEWSEFTEGGEVDDSEKALRAILEAKIMHKGDSISVGSIITMANGGYIEGLVLDEAIAKRIMRDNGMNFSKGYVVFQNGSKALNKMVSDTPFAADLSGQLLRVNGAKKFAGCRFGATMARAVGVPLSMAVYQDDNEPPI